MNKERYKNFVEDVYSREDHDLSKAMRNEIELVIKKNQDPKLAAEMIMDLIWATRYEW